FAIGEADDLVAFFTQDSLPDALRVRAVVGEQDDAHCFLFLFPLELSGTGVPPAPMAAAGVLLPEDTGFAIGLVVSAADTVTSPWKPTTVPSAPMIGTVIGTLGLGLVICGDPDLAAM